jgi:hypothetical protein
MIEELARVVLTADVPEQGLRGGDIGAVVMAHKRGAGYTVAFLTLSGGTVAVLTLPASHVRPMRANEIARGNWRISLDAGAFNRALRGLSRLIPKSPASAD